MAKIIEIPEFQNEPLLDFSKPETREKIQKHLKSVRDVVLGIEIPLLISGIPVFTERKTRRENPSDIKETVGYICLAGQKEADLALKVLISDNQVKEWMKLSFEKRSSYLKKAAQLLRQKRYFFIALMAIETGKSFVESDAEICEAIDFLEYYSNSTLFLAKLNQETLISLPGEKNESFYIPIGKRAIGVSIQPWNFPLAISIGPLAAGLITGHAMIYKPAEQSSVIGYYLAKIFYNAGIPKEIFHFLPGYGEETGDYLVNHPAIKVIAFTGSKEVKRKIQNAVWKFNLRIIDSLPMEERYEKRIAVLESGGKGAIIVDSTADLDEAVVGVCDSAFSFQGQKCSACARIIIVGKTYEKFIQRLKERMESLPIGSPEDPKNQIGPLINKDAYDKVLSYMPLVEQEGKILAYGIVPQELKDKGYFVPPILVGDLSPDSRIAQEEIFGPLLAVFKANTFEEAIALVNHTEYGLTNGVFSRNPENIEKAKRELQAGNIYINRKITGAIVGRQPFGGMKMSGNSAKAGGWDYLLNFFDRKNICENTIRRGTPIE